MGLLFLYLLYSVPGKWGNSVAPLSWNGSELSLTIGHGYSRQGNLAIEELAKQGEQNVAVASLTPKTFHAKDYSAVNWSLTDVPPEVEIMFLWRTSENPDRTFARPLLIMNAREIDSLEMASDENWRGEIMGLALMVKGHLNAPMTVAGFSLEPASAKASLKKMLGRWFAFDGWQGTSINFLDGAAPDQEVPFVLAIAAIVLLALVLYLILSKIKRLHGNAAMVWCMVFLGWFALDARWQLNLFRQLDLTQQQFAGKSWKDKHLADWDAPLFDFIQQVKAKLPAAGGRVLYFSDFDDLRGKGTYYLYPQNVMPINRPLVDGIVKAGDYIVVFEKKDMQYDSSRQALVWNGKQTIPADLLLSSTGNFLLKVH
jgi:hypothetical protein